MSRTLLLALLVGLALLAGCRTYETEWTGTTGSPITPASPVSALAPSDATHLRGCLTGTGRDFTLVDAHTATPYRLDAENTEWLEMNAGRLVEISGERRDMPGAPHFDVREIRPLADSCPAVLKGATNELNRPPGAKVGVGMVPPSIAPPSGMPQRETPPPSSTPAKSP